VNMDEVEIDRSIVSSLQPPARNKATKKAPPERLPWFDQWRGARGPALRSLVVTIRAALDKYEKTTGDRRRARRPDDQRRYEIAVETVVANLAHAALFNWTDSRLAILTGNKTQGFTRYDNEALGKPLRTLLGGLESLGMVEWRWSLQRGLASSVAPTERLVQMVRDAGVTLEDFGRLANEEVISLSRKPVATLDYSSMFARLAYARKGVQPPEGDLYAIPGLEGHRDAVKLGVSALLFDQHTRRQWPKTEEPVQRLPTGWTVARFRNALIERHPLIADCFGTGLGFQLMHVESEIMVQVLTTVSSEGVTALPLHDGILVRKSHASMGKEAMEEVSRGMTSYVLPVTCSM
jgi:hypothetical protein